MSFSNLNSCLEQSKEKYKEKKIPRYDFLADKNKNPNTKDFPALFVFAFWFSVHFNFSGGCPKQSIRTTAEIWFLLFLVNPDQVL
jgi:hypothetical protein